MSPHPPKPRKLRSGRRQFSGMRGPSAAPGGPSGPHGGTEQEWEQVMQSPHVQAALRDPGIQQALYSNLQSSVPGGMSSIGGLGSIAPPPGGPPTQMADGGMADALDIQEAMQMLNDPSTSEARKQSLRASLARIMQRHVPPPPAEPEERAKGGPLRFQSGGTYDMQEELDIQQQLANPDLKPQQRQLLFSRLNRLQQQRLQPQQQQSSIPGPGGTTISGSTMSGLNQLAGQGPATPANTALSMGAGALLGLGSTRMQGMSALVGAGTAGLLNFLIRKYGKGAQKPMSEKPPTQSTAGADRGQQTVTTNQEPQLERPAGTGTQPTAPGATTTPSQPNAAPNAPKSPGAPTEVPVPEPWRNGWSNPSAGSSGSATPGSSSGSGMMMGSANSTSGSVISNDGGKTWRDQQTGQPYSDPVINQTPITPGSSLTNATPQTTPSLSSADLAFPSFPPVSGETSADLGGLGGIGSDLSGIGSDASLMDEFGGFKKGGPVKRKRKLARGGDVMPPVPAGKPKAVLLRKPPLPVLHTTIVIAASPKKEKKEQQKKQAGGVIRPVKVNLLPPKRGPQDGEDRPRAHGRVQVPRGSGAAIRGKRFGGIY